MARSLPENGDAVRMPLLGFPGPGAGKGMASCHAFSAVHAAIRVSRMAVRHAAWTDNGRGFNPQAMMDCGMGLSNIASRINSLGGTFDISSSKGKGMRAAIRVNTQQDPAPVKHRKRRRR